MNNLLRNYILSRRIVGWSMADHMRAELVSDGMPRAPTTNRTQSAGTSLAASRLASTDNIKFTAPTPVRSPHQPVSTEPGSPSMVRAPWFRSRSQKLGET